MDNKLTRIIYDASPYFLKDVFTTIYGYQKRRLRFTGNYEKWFEFFGESIKWPEQHLRDFQEEKLREMVKHCYEKVPYYYKLFERLRLSPGDIKSIEDLKKLPILEKADVKQAGTELLSTDCDLSSLSVYFTAGSTGTPLKLYRSKDMSNMEYASMWGRRRPGMKLGDPYSSFTGLEIVRASRNKPPFWRNNWAANQRMYSIFHISEQVLPYYVESLNCRYSKFYAGYPSVIYTIADFMHRHGLSLDRPPQAVFAVSEELQPAHREGIEQILGTRVYNHYGQGEMVASINEFSCGHLHYEMDYSIIEFLEVGREEGLIKAEVIGTHLYMKEWPLLRYRTGDLVLYDPNDTCSSIPGTVIRRIYGRTGQYFELPDGRLIRNITVIARKCKNVRMMQVVQDEPGKIRVRIVKDDNYSRSDEREIEEQFRHRIGCEIKMNFEYVNVIERTRSGKYLAIINRMHDSQNQRISS